MTVARALRLALAATAVPLLASCGASSPPTARSPIDVGQALAGQRGCVACHSVTGNAGVGPTWKGLAGSTVVLTEGVRVMADTSYLERSIREPNAQLVEGFTTQMPQLGLSDTDVAALVAYIESLR